MYLVLNVKEVSEICNVCGRRMFVDCTNIFSTVQALLNFIIYPYIYTSCMLVSRILSGELSDSKE